MQQNSNLRPPKRPGFGTVGRPIKLRANFFCMNISPRLSDLYQYNVEITPDKCPREVKRDVVNEIVIKYRSTVFQGHGPAFDGEKRLYSRIKLPTPVSESICESSQGTQWRFPTKYIVNTSGYPEYFWISRNTFLAVL